MKHDFLHNLREIFDGSNVFLKWVGTFIALTLFIYLILQQDWKNLWINLQNISVMVILLVCFLFLTRIVINSIRWFILLGIARIDIPLLDCIELFFLGMFFSNFLPTTIGGDGVRFLGLMHYEDDRSKVLSSIVIDRIINLFAILILFPLPIIVFSEIFSSGNGVKTSAGYFLSTVSNKFQKLKANIQEFLERNKFWFESPNRLLLSLVVTWLSQLFYYYGIWILARNLGMKVSLIQVVSVSVFVYLATLLPISINGYGVREVTITTLYSILGFPLDGAISLAIVSRLIYFVTSLFGGIWLPKYFSKINSTV